MSKLRKIITTTLAFAAVFLIVYMSVTAFLLASDFKNVRTTEIENLSEDFFASKSHNKEFNDEYTLANNVVKFLVIDIANENQPMLIGSGTAFQTEKGVFYTNKHNYIKGCESCVYAITHNDTTYQAIKITANKNIDLASFYVYDHIFEEQFVLEDSVEICEEDVKIGDRVWSFGFGSIYLKYGSLKQGFANTNTSAFELGDIHLNQERNSMVNMIGVYKGDSGSPIFKKGENCVVGVINAGVDSESSVVGYVSHKELYNFDIETWVNIQTMIQNQENKI